jgi:propionyl-CoA synthetase
VCGYDVKLLDELTGAKVGTDQKGVLAIVPPLPPGCMTTVWGDDRRFVQTYFETLPGRSVYSTFDWATRDADGYYFVLGRTDDVINVAGHRLGTREIEEAVQAHPASPKSLWSASPIHQGPDPGGVRGGEGSIVGCHRGRIARCEPKC